MTRIVGAALLLLALAWPAAAQPAVPAVPPGAAPVVEAQAGPRAAPTTHIEVGNLPVMDTTPDFDAEKATAKYLSRIGGEARAKSDSYFEGGYWLLLLDVLYALAVGGFLLWTGLSARLRDWAADRTHVRTYQVLLYVLVYVPLVAALTFPLSFYEGYLREHSYGLSNQTFMAWLGDYGIGLAVGWIAALVVLPIFYAAIRRAENWWLWGAGIAIAVQVVAAVIWPIYIAPLTNHYSPLPASPVKQQILSLARANDVPADNVWLVDASRQSTRVSANVSGFLGTTRITLNDNLMKQGSPGEVLAVLGHEMGHYVMGHTLRGILLGGLVTLIGFAFLNWGFLTACDFFGGQWQVRRVEDIAGLPLLAALMSLFFFLATPVTNTIIRSAESQADIFGLDAVRKPDDFATVMLKLSSYRKLEPGKWEEIIFYDHPSGRTRIAAAMRWKKEHIADPDIRDSAKLP